MKKYLAVLGCCALLVTACGDDDAAEASIDPSEASTCDELADATIDLTQDVIDMMGDMTPEELAAAGSDSPPPEVVSVEERGLVIADRAREMSCSTLTEMITARVDRLEAEPENAMGQLIILGVRNGDDVMRYLLRSQ
jgi:hypothetical protein